MKKWIAGFLLVSLLLSLCACGGDAAEPTAPAAQGLQVGFGREKIMPEGSVPLAGYADTSKRMSVGYRDYLYITCIAFTEGDETVLMVTQDLFKSEEGWADQARALITNATGIPVDKIMICSTRNHAGPDLTSEHNAIAAYKTLYFNAAVAAAKAALADRSAATLYSTSTETEKLNYPRHYKLSDGSYGSESFGDFKRNTILGYANEIDNTMLLVKADREGDKQDVLIMNWQVYPCVFGTDADTNLSSDFIGFARSEVEQQTGMLCAYFTGAAGDIKPDSMIPADRHNLSDMEYAHAVAQYAIHALPGLTALEGAGISSTQVEFTYDVNHDDEDLLPQAKEVLELAKTSPEAAATKAKELGLHSVLHAQHIVGRPVRPPTEKMELNVVKVGGMAFVAAPFEMFSGSGEYIRENSPFAVTVICSCANENRGCFATKEAYDYDSYESYTNYFARGCAEATAEQFVKMLKEL